MSRPNFNNPDDTLSGVLVIVLVAVMFCIPYFATSLASN